MAAPLDREEFLTGFLAEADEHIRSASDNLLALEKVIRSGEPQTRLVRELFRSLHTLKGLAAMVDVEPVVEIAHEMESILRTASRTGGKLALAAVDLLAKGIRAIEQRVRAVADRKPVPAAPPALLAQLANLQPEGDASKGPGTGSTLHLAPEFLTKLTAPEQEQLAHGIRTGRNGFRVDFVPSPARMAQGITITTVRERVGKLAEILKVIPRSVPPTPDSPAALTFTLIVITPASAGELAEAASTTADLVTPILVAAELAADPGVDDEVAGETSLGRGFVRVDVARLDEALENLSALVVTRFRLARAVGNLREHGADVRELTTILAENARQLRDLRASIMKARMVTVAELLARVPLIVRGLGQRTGKEIHLQIDAGKAELDKAVAERIFPALVHLIRNAVDHALEPPEERKRLGKSPVGVIKVTCFEHSDSQLELEIADDGRGIDSERVARLAQRPVPTNERELLEILCLPGLSTTESATMTSGRGMGMNIVKRTVEMLGGDMQLQTKRGLGSSFRLRIPLSISILDAFAFECGKQPFVVPVAMIEEIVEIEAAHVFSGPGSPGVQRRETRLLRRRNQIMPLIGLASLLELSQSAGKALKALVVRRNGDAFAFAVDRMLGQQEVVIRPLEDVLVKSIGVTGTTDLGDGKPTLVLDLIALTGSPRLEAAAV